MTRDRSLDVAVTGVAARLPGCASVDDWWSALLAGRVLTTRYERGVLLAAGVSRSLVDDPDYVPVRGHLFDADRFDNALFKISPREAELMDPQHRLMLETVWSALEDACTSPLDESVQTGVFASASGSGYLRSILAHGELDPAALDDVLHGTEPDFMAGRVAYKLGLSGPALAVQTACSSSLVGIHLATQSLLNGDCDQAVVVGAGIGFPQAGHLHLPGGILSATGECRPFDAGADGVVVGSGVASVVLRRLTDALEDGPEPYGVVLGTAINNDGAAKAGFFAPSGTGQEAVIRAALRAADVDAGSLGYLETHGTGTPIGDPIEWAAACAALSATGARPGQIAVGALKANVGHLDAAAGVAALIKALLVVKTGLLPPVAGFTALNPLLGTANAPLFVPVEAQTWTGPQPRRAGVSAFGIGGTNAHVIIEQAPPAAVRHVEPASRGQLLVLSAGDAEALARSAARLAEHLSGEAPDLADASFTLAAGRAELCERLAVCGRSTAEVADRLVTAARQVRKCDPVSVVPVVLVFPGQGTQYPGMARPLAESLPGFWVALHRCLDEFGAELAARLRRALLETDIPATELAATELAQPALFAVEYSAAVALAGLGLTPVAVAGHSAGEVAAACVAGVLDLPGAARFVATRGRAMQACAAGAMLALGCDEPLTRHLLAESGHELELAASNSATSTVLAGTVEAVEAFRAWLGERVFSRRLCTSHAFHSALMEPALPQLDEAVAAAGLRSPSLPFASNRTGRIVPAGAAVAPELFVEQARRPVRYREAMTALERQYPSFLTVEVGPGRTLSAMTEASGRGAVALSAARTDRPGDEVLAALGTLWSLGHSIDASALCRGGRRIHLPGYSFAGPRRTAREAAARDPAPRPPRAAGPSGAPPVLADAVAADTPAPKRPPTDGGSPSEASAVLRALWSELLGRDDLTDGSDFFELGGDSLLITRLARRVNAELGITVPVRDMLAVRTLGRQTAIVWGLVGAGASTSGESAS